MPSRFLPQACVAWAQHREVALNSFLPALYCNSQVLILQKTTCLVHFTASSGCCAEESSTATAIPHVWGTVTNRGLYSVRRSRFLLSTPTRNRTSTGTPKPDLKPSYTIRGRLQHLGSHHFYQAFVYQRLSWTCRRESDIPERNM